MPRPERPAAPRTKDAPLRAALANRRGRALDEGIAAACYTHGVRLGLAGEPLPDWLPTAPRWAREALGTGHASGLAIHRREKRGDSAGGPMP
ncbi:hypothetical protein CKO45_02215 [Paracraurococcus ruber]|uniref:Uncharacterized protein n=1 Tax=Paracraurococcus ruber TaxID=77675 RepID=A0ABS1CRH5_9PROT|nr:hypothetical protein [Paracraurococcus ruber]